MKELKKQEKEWVLYDVGNSAFVLLCKTIIPIYFKNIAGGGMRYGLLLTDRASYVGGVRHHGRGDYVFLQ